MDINISLSLLITIGGMIVTIASTFAIIKTKVIALEKEFEEVRKLMDIQKDDLINYREDEKVRIAILERNQEAHNKELEEIKGDIKITMEGVQEIKEALIKKGEM